MRRKHVGRIGLRRSRAGVAGLAIAVLATLIAVPAAANHDVPILPDVFPKIRAIVSPLASQPSILEDGSVLRVELDPDRVGDSLTADVEASLRPSFGSARGSISLESRDAKTRVNSALWPGRDVHVVMFSIPTLAGSFVEDLYDLTVSYGAETDTQHRAVKIVDSYPANPTVAVIADPSVGDPRPIQEGADNFVATGSPDSFLDKTTKTVGNPMNEDRWAALGRAIDEINVLQPDFVLVAGDLTFAVYPRPVNVEYEDAYRILSRLRVPAYVTPGNHDLYDLDYDDLDRPHTSDGKELWPLYFGPLHYSVDVGPEFHLVSINTFDWADNLREPADESREAEIRSGGQIQDKQFDWLQRDLTSYRKRNPKGTLITFAHHDPSWIEGRHPWDGKNRLETRDLLAKLRVGIHFAGHTHEDRVARYHEGNVVETNGRFGPDQELHYVSRKDKLDESWTEKKLGSILRDPSHGPLFVTTTTVSSVLKGEDWGLGGYWGYRFGVLDQHAGAGGVTGFDPKDLGYPATREFLDGRAERPQKWNPDHAVYGVFSYPSYLLDASADGSNDGTEPASSITVTNNLVVDVEVEVLLSVKGADPRVRGGDVLWIRSANDNTDVRVRATIRSGDEVTITARTN